MATGSLTGGGAGMRRVRIRAVHAGPAEARSDVPVAEARTDVPVAEARTDVLAVEEPLEIRLERDGRAVPLAVTMRTPGADVELVVGFLFAEGIVAAPADVPRVGHCADAALAPEERANVVTATLRTGLVVDLRRMQRHFQTTSACGVCGKGSLDQLERQGLSKVGPGPAVPAAVIHALPATARAAQGLFAATGGIHAAALFDPGGRLVALREDVGRHNAVDKLVGWAFLNGALPLAEHVVLVSGRASFEIMQKCVAAGVPIVCAVSAPSSLAVDVAVRFDQTLVGFLRGGRFNIYSGARRVALG